MYFYSDTQPRTQSSVNVWEMNGSEAYLRRFDNYLILHAFATKDIREDRAAAEKEIIICNRKRSFWERLPNFDAKLVRGEKEGRIRIWNEGRQ